ncbi:MAG: sec-independent protein translocase protein TatC [Anaerolineaceae bacterium]|nr:MAG: sec-independent protein translocase protein TatC [Anaerolineaceae bacterium]
MRKFLRGLWKVITFPFRLLWRVVTLPARGIRGAWRFVNAEPEDRPLSDSLADTIKKPSTLVPHIEALRRHILHMLIALLVGVAVCGVYTEQILEILARSIGGLQALQALDPTESVGVFMRVALFGGFALALPYIAFEFWLFAAPGLRPRERRIGLAGIPFALAFFLGGIAFTYWLLLPTALPFLLDFLGVTANWRLSTYINFVTGLMFWIGVSFEFPLVIYVLTAMGIVKPGGLARQWRIAVIVIAVLAAAITPTPDPLNMSLVMLPMILLYFLSIALSYLASAGRKKNA